MSAAKQPLPLRDEAAFAAVVEPHRAELQVHCYRMLGSLEDSEDLVQETFLRAWRKRASFGADGRVSIRAWLYRIATNACLDVLRTRPRRVMPEQVAPAGDPAAPPPPPADLPWLQPYPDRLIAPAAREVVLLDVDDHQRSRHAVSFIQWCPVAIAATANHTPAAKATAAMPRTPRSDPWMDASASTVSRGRSPVDVGRRVLPRPPARASSG
jgi:RNA polymerase sigma factor (sigma-70 family)